VSAVFEREKHVQPAVSAGKAKFATGEKSGKMTRAKSRMASIEHLIG